MSSSKTLNNLNIRKFPSKASFKNATNIGEDDLCVVAGSGEPLMQLGTMPTAGAEWEGQTVMFVGTSTPEFTDGYLYRCMGNGDGTYFWTLNETQPSSGGIDVNTTATLAVADWSSNTQTVTVSGVKSDSVVFVSPAPASASDYASAGILCTAQAADSLTFTCTTTPTNAITVNVVCM